MKKQGDFIRSRIYSRAQDTILSFEGDITDINQLEGNLILDLLLWQK